MLRRIRNTWHFIFHRNRFDDELAEEMEFHRRMLEADKVRDGFSPEAAAADARRKLGNIVLAGESSRAVWSISWLDALMGDMRHAVRESLRHPVLTVVAILSLALGIGVVCIKS